VHGYSEIVYSDVWKGVDLRLYGNGPDLEQEFIVRPGADVSHVQVAYQGIERLRIEKDGSLLIKTAAGEMRENAPRIFQQIADRRISVEGRFRLLTATSYTFDVSAHNAEYALVVDPTVLYSTYLGGSAGNNLYTHDAEVATGIAVDATGSAYVTGYTFSTDFPTTAGAFQTTSAGGQQTFITKLNSIGSALVYSTYLSAPFPATISVDRLGNAYVAGWNASTGFPTTPNAYSQSCSGSGFLSVLNQSGTGLVYSTCFGGPGSPQSGFAGPLVSSMVADTNGHAFITGSTNNPSFPTTPNAFQASYPTRGPSAFAMAFDTNASGAASLTYSTYFGIPSNNSQAYGTQASAIAADQYGNMYITGYAGDSLPVTPGAFQTSLATGIMCNPFASAQWVCPDGFVAKFKPSATAAASLIYSTYLGGPGNDSPLAIAVDNSGDAYVTGYTLSQSFPVTQGAFQTTAPGIGGNTNGAFVSKLNASGSNLIYSTYLYGNSPSSGNGIAVDPLGNAYVAGNFQAGGHANPFFPVTADAFQSSFIKLSGDFQDAFLTKLNPTGSALVYSSYLGGQGDDVGTAVAVDQAGDAYITGHTSSGNFPIISGAFQPGMDGTGDAFVTKFPLGAAQTLSVSSMSPSSGGNTGTVTGRILGAGFHAGASLTLTGGVTITGTSLVGTEGRTIDFSFDLTSAPAGSYGLTVVNPDGTSITSPNAFSVQSGGGPQLGVSLIMPSAFAINRGPAAFNVTVRNTGNVDAQNVILALYGVPSDAVLSPLFNISPPPVALGGQRIDFSGTPFAPIVGQEQIPTLLLSRIPAGNSIALNFSLALTALPPVPPLTPPPPGPPTTSLGNLRITGVVVPLESLCKNKVLGCIEGALSIGLIPFPELGIPLAWFTCFQDFLCIKLKQLHPDNSNPVYNVDQLFLKEILDCAGAVAPGISKLVELVTAEAGIITTVLDCIDLIVDERTGSAEATLGFNYDPNDKKGVLGATSANWIQPQALSYAVYFSNEPTATAASSKVLVTDLIDSSIDVSSLSLNAIFVAGNVLPVPAGFSPALGHSQGSTTIDFRPSRSLLITADVSIDLVSRVLTAQFTSTDPTTGLPPSDPNVGVLPPGAEGVLVYSAKPIQTATTGTQISNQATIIFDTNAAMTTPTWVNTIDNTAPTSQVGVLPATEPLAGFTVNWSGTDSGSGVQDFTIYESDNGGPFTVWLQNTASTSATFTGQLSHAYGFYSIARDLVGNVEGAKTVAEATTQVVQGVVDNIPPITTSSISPLANAAGWNNSNVIVRLNSADNPGGTGVNQVTYSISGAQTAPNTTVTGSSASFTIATEGISTISFFATDNAGNVESAHMLTIQLDKTPPAFATFPASLTVPPASPAGTVVTYTLPTATDALSGVSTAGVSCVPAPGSTFPLGTTTVTCNVADNAGNVATGNFTVSVALHYSFKWIIGKPAPALNSAEVSDGYKVAFNLGGNFGLNVVTAVASTPIACSGPKGAGLPEADGRLGLSYNAKTGDYQESFAKPGRNAAGTCAQINLTLYDGTNQAINIKYVK